MASPAEEAAAGHPGWAQHLDPGGVPRVPVVDIVLSLRFYLDEMGCVVREVADGWALLGSGPFALLLIHEPTPPTPARLHLPSDPPTAEMRSPQRPAAAATPIPPPLIQLSTPDLRALRCRLGADVPPAGLVPGPTHDPVDEIDMYDPDQHRVVVTQSGSCSQPQQRSLPGKKGLGHRQPPPNDLSSQDVVQRHLRDAALDGSQT